MTFAGIAHGECVFLDANTLVYHFEPHPTFGPACSQLIARIENQEVLGFTAGSLASHATRQFERGA